MKDEILYIASTYKRADYYLESIVEKLHSLGINFKYDRANSLIETDKYNIFGLSINGSCLSLHNSRTMYYMVANGSVDLYKFDTIFHFRECAKELHSIDEIIEKVVG